MVLTTFSPELQKWIIETSEVTYDSGDVNMDKKTDINDFKMIDQYLIKKEKFSNEQCVLADVNGDGKINIFDLIALKRKIQN